MISGFSLDDIHDQSLFHIKTMSIISINHFIPLTTILSEYTPLLEIDLEISLSDDRQFIIITLIDCEFQDNFINELYIKNNVISFEYKSQFMILYLIDERETHQKDLI